MTILGIDPGRTGAIACMTDDGRILWVEDMPDCTGSALGAAIAALILGEQVAVAVVELVGAMPRQGVSSTWKFAEGTGAILGALGALGVRVERVTAAQWKRGMKVTAAKESSRQRARELWPQQADLFRRVKDDGRAEACLLAEWWRTRAERSAP